MLNSLLCSEKSWICVLCDCKSSLLILLTYKEASFNKLIFYRHSPTKSGTGLQQPDSSVE